jgi:phosphonate transport system ATP-binding protein
MQDPEIILADEPIAALDPVNAALVMDALARINRERGISVLVNLHALDAVRRWCPRAIGMAAGKVVFDAAPARLDGTVLDGLYGGVAKAMAAEVGQ